MELSQEQSKAVFTESKTALCLAGAGSGKTRVLIGRIQNLLENCHVSPYEVMAVTFTRKAGKEMLERLERSVGLKAFGVSIGTLHSVALKMIQRFGEFIGLNPGKITVYSSWEEGVLLKDVCKELGYYDGKKWRKGAKRKEIEEAFYLFYTRKQRNERNYIPTEIMDAFFLRCRENNALTYGMIMTSFLDLIPKIGRMLKFKHILCDEVQDLDPLQWRILKLICSICDASLFAVGDDSQCQPAGTMVETLKGCKQIENLDPEKDELYTYDRHDAMVYGGHNRGYKFKKASRIFSGNMYEVSANGTSTRCTPNHKWWVKWSDYGRDPKWNVVYLMRQGNRFRIGWCQLFQSYPKHGKNTFHLWQRARLEKADAVWVLRIFDNKKEASLWESILSTQYGIPTITFEGINSQEYYDKEGIDLVFDKLGDLTTNAWDIIDDHGLEIDYPFHSIERNNQKRGGCSIFEIEACNMIPEFFIVPHRKDDTRYIKWSVADIKSESVSNITVYSLDVEKNHTYIADGLCTKNSIYSFRGADPDYIIRNQDKFDIYKLKDNYRSDGQIVASANKLIKHNINRLDLEMNAIRPNINQIDIYPDMNSQKIVDELSQTSYIDGGNIAVLGRNHFLLEKLSRLLSEAGIDHEHIGKKTAFTRSEEFRRVHAFLNLAVNPFDNFSFLLCKEYFEINIPDYMEIRLQAVRENKSHFQVFTEKISNESDNIFQAEYIEAVSDNDFKGVLYWLKGVDFEFDASPVLDFINEYLAITNEPKINEYLDWLALFDVQDEIKEEPKKLQLMTIHASKGLEWSMVIIAGMNNGILPSFRSKSSPPELESERRLAYVAYTRARDHLILTSRPVHPDDKIKKLPSQFIKESF